MPRKIHTLGEARETNQHFVAVCDRPECRHKWSLDLNHVIEFTGVRHPLLPQKGHRHYSERLKCPACKESGAFVWPEELPEAEPMLTGLSYSVNNWGHVDTGSLLSVIAKVTNVMVAHATFAAAIIHYPGNRITLQQGAFVIRDSRFPVVEGGRRYRR